MSKLFKRFFSWLKSLFGGKKVEDSTIVVQCCYGGLDFTKAKEDPNAVIGDLVVNNDAMKYSWVKGNLRGWGLADTAADAIAVFAVKGNDGKWRGGKFEWISKSRTTRAFTNIKAGYAGWPRDAVAKATGYAFCICSKDAKRRTNWITTAKRTDEARIRATHTALKDMD